MNKLAIIPIFFLTMCGTAPITDPPAHACSPRLDGKPTYCPDERDLILLPREEARGEINIRDPYHLAKFTDDVSKKYKKRSDRKKCNLTF